MARIIRSIVMADLSTLTGLTFSPDNYASQSAFFVDFSQVDAGGTGTLAVSADGPVFSNADTSGASGQNPVSAMIVSVDTSDATSYRLGTVVVNEMQDDMTGTSVLYGSYTADIIAVNGGQVLLGETSFNGGAVSPYDTTNPTNPYNNNYAFLSDTSVSTVASGTTFMTTVSNTDPNAYSPPPCFAAGTMIRTPQGEVAVETLRVGDVVVTLTGGEEQVIWVGSRHVDIARHPQPETVRPIRIRANAFADGLPSRDILVSPDHSIHADDVLIPAKYLVNCLNVVVSEQASVTYHHFELGQHEVVFANGLPAETYLDTGNRMSFHRREDTVFVPHPDFSTISDLAFFTWDAQGYAELVVTGPRLERVRSHLAARAKAAKADTGRVAA
jgi:hypothetical protein